MENEPADPLRPRDYLATLLWLQPFLEDGVVQATGRALVHRAPLAKALTDVTKAIDEIKPPEEMSALDQLTAKRAERRGAASAG